MGLCRCHYRVQKHEPCSEAGEQTAPESYDILAPSQRNNICLLKVQISYVAEGEGTLGVLLI